MDVRQYSEFLRLQGYTVVGTKSCRWYNIRPLFYESFPVFARQRVGRKEVIRLLSLHRCLGLRYVCGQGEAYSLKRRLYLCDDTSYDFRTLHTKARNQTRRGLERCEVRRVSWDFLRDDGFKVKTAAQCRQGAHRQMDLDRKKWERYLYACSRFPEDIVAYGAFVRRTLSSFVIAVIVEDHAMIQTFHNLPDQSTAYSANAIIFSATRELFCSKDVRAVTLGAQTLEPMPTLERFKTRMGFRAHVQNFRLVLHPLLWGGLSIPRLCGMVERFLESRGRHIIYAYKSLQVLRALNISTPTSSRMLVPPQSD